MIWPRNIPKTLFLYWDGSPMSYLTYLTVKSFRKYHPLWTIKLYMPKYRHIVHNPKKYNSKDYFNLIQEHNVQIIQFDFEDIGYRNDIGEIYKSDIIRYYLLYKYGGVWSDMDVLFIKPLESYPFHPNMHVGITYFDTYYTIGFLMSSENNPFYKTLYKKAINKNNLKYYQEIGTIMIKKLYSTPNDIRKEFYNLNIDALPNKTYLPIKTNQLDLLFNTNVPSMISDETFAIHWFNGSTIAKEFQKKDNEQEIVGTLSNYLTEYINDKDKLKQD